MPGTPGALTTDDVPLLFLYNEFRDSVERHNEMDRNFKDLFCQPPATKKRTVTIRQRSMRFQESGEDTTQPDYQHVDRRDIDLEAPRRWVIGTGITARAYEEGIDSAEVREHNAEIIDADNRLIQEVIIRRALWNTAGGWYNGALAVAPPNFKMNRFTVAHDHYLAANVAGVPLLAHFTALKEHIQHHGYTRNMIAFMNIAQATNVVNNTEWATAPGPMPTRVMENLQELGLVPGFMAAGIPVYPDDWIPENYILVTSLDDKPMKWRIPEGGDKSQRNTHELMLFQVAAGDESLSVKYLFIQEAARWTSATVALQGAAAVIYLGGPNYVNPTGFYV